MTGAEFAIASASARSTGPSPRRRSPWRHLADDLLDERGHRVARAPVVLLDDLLDLRLGREHALDLAARHEAQVVEHGRVLRVRRARRSSFAALAAHRHDAEDARRVRVDRLDSSGVKRRRVARSTHLQARLPRERLLRASPRRCASSWTRIAPIWPPSFFWTASASWIIALVDRLHLLEDLAQELLRAARSGSRRGVAMGSGGPRDRRASRASARAFCALRAAISARVDLLRLVELPAGGRRAATCRGCGRSGSRWGS